MAKFADKVVYKFCARILRTDNLTKFSKLSWFFVRELLQLCGGLPKFSRGGLVLTPQQLNY